MSELCLQLCVVIFYGLIFLVGSSNTNMENKYMQGNSVWTMCSITQVALFLPVSRPH
jgi:hypothetical protein